MQFLRAPHAAEDGGAANKPKLEDNEAASEDEEIVPDLDDPHIPTWVWDWHLVRTRRYTWV